MSCRLGRGSLGALVTRQQREPWYDGMVPNHSSLDDSGVDVADVVFVVVVVLVVVGAAG